MKLPDPSLLRRVMPDDYKYGDVFGYTIEQMRAYATKCVRAEREECAKIAESVNNYDNPMTAKDVASAIRFRGFD